MDDDSLMIDSATDPEFSGRNYNKLLRCTVLLLSLLLSKQLQRVTSHAMNPISAYLLLHYFDGIVSPMEENRDLFDFLEQNGSTIHSCSTVIGPLSAIL